jgi:hypothetical protein
MPYFPNPPFDRWTKWQYSGDGGYRVRGILGDCDRDLFNGDLSAFRAYMGLPDGGTGEPDAPIVHPVVTTDDGTGTT